MIFVTAKCRENHGLKPKFEKLLEKTKIF